jgi:excisionase family DNA binding protein
MLRSSQLAKKLGLSKQKVVQLANAGDIPALRLPGGHYRFDFDEVVEALRASEAANDER